MKTERPLAYDEGRAFKERSVERLIFLLRAFHKMKNINKKAKIMLKKSKSISILLTIVFMLSIVGLVGQAIADEKVTFWGPFSGPDGKLISKMVDRFNKQHPEISVQFVIVPWEQYYDKVTVSVAAGNPPNCCIMHAHFLPQYAHQNVLTPLEELAKQVGIKKEDYIPSLWNAGIYEGRRYGLPLDCFPRFLFYNKRLLREAGLDPNLPKTEMLEWSVMKPWVKKLTQDIDGDGKTDQWGFAWENERRCFINLLWQMGGELLTKDLEKAAFDSPESIKALQLMVDTIYKDKIACGIGADENEMLMLNKVAVVANQITNLASFVNVKGLELGSSPFPLFGKEKVVFGVGHSLIIPKQRMSEEKKEATMSWLKWLMEHTFEWATVGQVPANLKVIRSPELKEELPHQYVAASQWQYFRIPPKSIDTREYFFSALVPGIQKALAGELSSEEALSEAADKANRILR